MREDINLNVLLTVPENISASTTELTEIHEISNKICSKNSKMYKIETFQMDIPQNLADQDPQ